MADIFSMYATEALILDDYQELEEMFRQWKDIRNHYIVDTTAQDAEGLAHIHRIYLELFFNQRGNPENGDGTDDGST